jgi:Tat protein translocase TatC
MSSRAGAQRRREPFEEGKVLTILEHLQELRRRLIIASAALLIGVVVSAIFTQQFLHWLTAPAKDQVQDLTIIYTEPLEYWGTYFRVALVAGVAVAMPVIVYQILAFVGPGLTRQERRWVYPLVLGATLAFLGGAAFAYYVELPPALRFLLGFSGDVAEPNIKIGSYVNFVTRLMLVTGLRPGPRLRGGRHRHPLHRPRHPVAGGRSHHRPLLRRHHPGEAGRDTPGPAPIAWLLTFLDRVLSCARRLDRHGAAKWRGREPVAFEERKRLSQRRSVTRSGAPQRSHGALQEVSPMGRRRMSIRHIMGLAAVSILAAALLRTDSVGAPLGATERVSVDSAGNEANSASFDPDVSADSRYVAFLSTASNLVPRDTNNAPDIFVHDRYTQATERVSVSSSGEEASGSSYYPPAISADGRFVVFDSSARNLAPDSEDSCVSDHPACSDVFIHDRVTRVTELVSVDIAGNQSTGRSFAGDLSADGRYVVFSSYASNLVAGDTNNAMDIFVRDRQTRVTERISVDSAGKQADGNSRVHVSMSADGRYVAFVSAANNLVADDTNLCYDPFGNQYKCYDVFIHDRQTGSTERVSVDSLGNEGTGHSGQFGISLSADGRYVAFDSEASNLVAADTNDTTDVFIYDRESGATRRVSVDGAGGQANGRSYFPALSADGRFLAFASEASDLVPGDENDQVDIFLSDLATGDVKRVSVSSAGEEANGRSVGPALSGDGTYVAFWSIASNLVSSDHNNTCDSNLDGVFEDNCADVFVHSPLRPLGCFLEDQKGNGTRLWIWGENWTFTGPGGFEASGTGARRHGDRVIIAGRSGDVVVSGTGLCPSGPGYFSAIELRRPPAVFRLIDRG